MMINSWKCIIIDTVGINEQADIFIQAIDLYFRHDYMKEIWSDDKINKYLLTEVNSVKFIYNNIEKIEQFILENEDSFNKLEIILKIHLARLVLNGKKIDDSYIRKANQEIIHQDISELREHRWEFQAEIDKDYEKSSSVVRLACQELGLTQKELAERLEVSKPSVDRWASTGEIPESSKKLILFLLENENLKKELNELKHALRVLHKHGL